MKYVQPQNVFSVRKKEHRVRIKILFILGGCGGEGGVVNLMAEKIKGNDS